MPSKFFKSLILLLILSVISSCGYQPLFTEKYQNFSVNNFNIVGDRKLGQSFANKFGKIEAADNNLTFNIDASKRRNISNKSSSGTILEYNININFELEVISESDGKKVFATSLSESSNYKTSSAYTDTLSREKKIVDNLIKSLANQVNYKLNLIFKEK